MNRIDFIVNAEQSCENFNSSIEKYQNILHSMIITYNLELDKNIARIVFIMPIWVTIHDRFVQLVYRCAYLPVEQNGIQIICFK